MISPAIRLAGAAFLLAAGAGCGGDPGAPSGSPEPGAPRQVLYGAEMRQTSLRGNEWVLSARVAKSFAEGEPTQLEGLKVRFYDGSESVRSTLTSRRGEFQPERSILVAEDSVVVVTREHERLETEYLEWDPEVGRVRTPRPFTLYRGGDVVTGVGIEADPDLRHYTVSRDLRVVVRDEHPLEEDP
jgi:LPS export ABC transporter protein LptC